MNDDILTDWRSLMEQGTAFLGQGKYREAEKFYLRSLKLAKRLSVPEIQAFNLRLLSTARIKLGKVEEADRGFHEALLICQRIQNHKGMSEAMAGLASVAVAQENLEEAVSWYEQAINVYPATSPRLRLGMLFSDLGQVYSTMENWTNAQNAFLRARELCHIYGYRKGEGELSILLAEVSYRQSDVKLARKDLIYACKIFSETHDDGSLVNAIQYFAYIDFEEGKLEQALESWQRVIILYQRLAQWEDVSESAYFLANILQDLKNLAEAVYYLELSIQTYNRKDIGLGLRYQNIGQLLWRKEDYVAARDYLKKASLIFEQHEEELKLGETFENIAQISEALGESEIALAYRTKSKTSLEKHQTHSLRTTQQLAEYFEKGNNHLNALQYYWEALKIARELNANTVEIERAIQRVSRKVRRKDK